jgi:hypothetical protein
MAIAAAAAWERAHRWPLAATGYEPFPAAT